MRERRRARDKAPREHLRRPLLPWLASLSTGLMAVFAAGAIHTSMVGAPTLVEQQLYVSDLAGELTHLDELLTMSAWMAATTGEPRWQRRYDANTGRIHQVIDSLRFVTPALFGRELGADTGAAHARLAAMEARAFAQVAAGNLVAARQVLDSAAYRAEQVAYEAGVERVRSTLAGLVANESGATRRLGIDLLLGTLAVASVAALSWIVLLRRAHAAHSDAELARARTQRQAAEAANHQKSLFVANISHELRTPLTAILGYAELLTAAGSAVPTTDTVDAAATIARHGEHLLQVVNDLLDMSKLEAGKVVVESIATDPALVVDDVLSLLQVRASAKGLTLVREFTTPVPRRIHTDPGRLRQILVNLVGNAIKFTNVGGVRVSVALAAAGPRQRLSIAVADTGVGLSPQQCERLFQPFEQGDASTARRFGGTGLGLAIARQLAALLGGEIQVRSERGRGSVFTLAIAVDAADAADVHVPSDRAVRAALTPAPPAVRPTALAKMCILLAEDGRDSQRLFASHLRRAGAEVVTVDDGRQAVDRVAANTTHFDLVLMDMHMPELDGHGATKELRARGFGVPIVALTASAMSADRELCLAAGCDDYLTKPIAGDALVRACAMWAPTRC